MFCAADTANCREIRRVRPGPLATAACRANIDQTGGVGFAPSLAHVNCNHTTAEDALTVGEATYSYCVSEPPSA